MNILYLADPSSYSHDSKWMNFFSGTGHNVYLLVRQSHRYHIETSHLDRIKIIGFVPDFSILRPLSILVGVLKIRSAIKKYKIDIFHILYAEPNSLWAILRFFYRCRVGLTTRGTDVLVTIPGFTSGNHKRKYVGRLYDMAFRRLDFITCTSEAQRTSVLTISPKAKTPYLLRTGVDMENIVEFQKEHGKDTEKSKYVLFPRSMKPIYNHEFAISAIAKLNKNIKTEYKFYFLDKDSSSIDYVHEIEKLMKENSDVDFHYLIKQDKPSLYALYQNASLIVMTPKSDGSPVTALEAMAFKVPVILPPLNYDKDLFGDWTFKFSAWQPESLSELIESVLNQDHSKIVERAYEVVAEKASFRKEMGNLLKIYKS